MENSEYIILIVQVALLLAALWYSWETRKIRIQNLDEIRLIANQGRLALAPFLVPGATPKSEIVNNIRKDTDKEEKARDEMIEGLESSDLRYFVKVDNPTDKTGCHLSPYVFDPDSKSFLIPDHAKEWISPKDAETFQVSGPSFTKKKIEEHLIEQYGNVASSLFGHLETPEEEGYVVLFFRDIEGTLYVSKRSFTLKDGQSSHKASRLSCASGS